MLRADIETLPGKKYVKHSKPYLTKSVKEYNTIVRLNVRTWIEDGALHNKYNIDYKIG